MARVSFSKYTRDWYLFSSWWRHQMETFSALLAISAGNSPVSGEFPAQRPVTRSFDVFFDLCLDGRLSKHSWGWWLGTLSGPLWRQSDVTTMLLKRHGVSKLHCVLNRLFMRIHKNIKAAYYWPFVGDPPLIDGFPSQRASNAEIVSISIRHHTP